MSISTVLGTLLRGSKRSVLWWGLISPLATWYEELTHWKRPWSWERLKAGGEGEDRGWDSWMASPTQCTWIWVGSGSWWWIGKPGMLQSMGSQRIRHYWRTELNWRPPQITILPYCFSFSLEWFCSLPPVQYCGPLVPSSSGTVYKFESLESVSQLHCIFIGDLI